VLVMPNKSRIYRYLASRPLARADYIYTTAENVSSAIPALAKTSAPIVNLPFGVEVADFPFSPPSASGRLRIFSNRMFKSIYDVQTLVRAAKLLNGKADFELRLAGAGPLEAEIRQMVLDFRLSEKTQFLGVLNHSEMAKALAESDIFVSCSLSDSNNISLNEAMAVGTVPVVSKISANTPWISDGRNGFLFEPRNAEDLAAAILKAIDSRDKWTEIARENRTLIERKANWRTCVSETFRTYSELCPKSATQSN
jgi:L-malate glycosyltransferase